MLSNVLTLTRMMLELLIALFLTGMLAALTGGVAYGIASLAHF